LRRSSQGSGPTLKVSVIIVNWNGLAFLGPCLDSLRRQSMRDFEVLVIDNSSSDGSVEFVRSHYPEVRVLPQVSNLGFAAANNIGVRQVRSEFVALLNNDTEAEPDWLAENVTALESNRHIGFCASRILMYHDPRLADACGDYYTVEGAADKIGHMAAASSFDDVCEVFGACAGAAIYRRSMLEELGGFDEDFFIVHEDSDLSFRAQLMGYKCLYVPTAIVYHHVGATLRHTSDPAIYYAQRNSEFVYLKNMPLSLLARYWPLHMVMDALLFAAHARRGKTRSFIRAKFDALRQVPPMLSKRRAIQRARRASTEEIEKLLVKGWLAEKMRAKLHHRGRGSPAIVS
jgi:GT2 family glycosyltransferase